MNRLLKALQDAPEGIVGGHGFAPINGLSVHGGGGAPETQTTKTEPWEAQQPYLRRGFDEARALLNNNTLQYYPERTVAPQSEATQGAIANLENFGRGDYLQSIINSTAGGQQTLFGAADPSQNPLLAAGLQNMPSASDAINRAITTDGGSIPNLAEAGQEFSAQIPGANTADTYTSRMLASLGTPGQGNPYTDQVVQSVINANNQNFMENVMPRIESQAVVDNAYGGSRQALAESRAAESLNETNADAAARIYQSQLENDLNRSSQLSTAADQAGMGYIDQLMRTYGMGADMASAQQQLEQQNTGQQLSAAQMALNAAGSGYGTGLDSTARGMQLAPTVAQLPLTGIQAEAQAGAAQDAYIQSLLTDEVNRFNFNQNAPWDAASRYAQLISGNYGGTTTAPGPQQPSLGSQILGGATSGAGLASTMGLTGMAAIAPWAAGGAILGGLL